MGSTIGVGRTVCDILKTALQIDANAMKDVMLSEISRKSQEPICTARLTACQIPPRTALKTDASAYKINVDIHNITIHIHIYYKQ